MKLGLFVRRERWTLSSRGKFLVAGIVLTLGFAMVFGAYPFLALNRPISADVLLVEHWIINRVPGEVAAEFRRGHYKEVLILKAEYEPDAKLRYEGGAGSQEYIVWLLARAGVQREFIGMVHFPAAERDRTYHAALAARDWFAEEGALATSCNIVSLGPHSRRSWLMYHHAFVETPPAGIIALQDPTYDSNSWWRTSEGVREVVGESIAYIYARFFFAWI